LPKKITQVEAEIKRKQAATGHALVLGLVLLVGAFDYLIFANINKLSKRLSPVSLIISEVVFGILLTAVAVQLIVFGLGSLGIIAATTH
jgi:small neutral amino acid transporter SnatA (MarC family)